MGTARPVEVSGGSSGSVRFGMRMISIPRSAVGEGRDETGTVSWAWRPCEVYRLLTF